MAPLRRVDPALAGAVERQTAAMRAVSARAFPETDVPDWQPAPIEAARAQRQESEKTRTTAADHRGEPAAGNVIDLRSRP